MPRFFVRIVDRYQRVLGENELEEPDSVAAYNAALLAASVFKARSGYSPSSHLVIENEFGEPCASIDLGGKHF